MDFMPFLSLERRSRSRPARSHQMLMNVCDSFRLIRFARVCRRRPAPHPRRRTSASRSTTHAERRARNHFIRVANDAASGSAGAFRKNVYGRAPVGRPADWKFDVFDSAGDAMDGKTTRKQVRISYRGPGGEGAIRLVLFVPNDATRPARASFLSATAPRRRTSIPPAG